MEVRAKKALGQHFLVDQNVAQRIVAALEPGDGLRPGNAGTGLPLWDTDRPFAFRGGKYKKTKYKKIC